jgi:hypothetical protein
MKYGLYKNPAFPAFPIIPLFPLQWEIKELWEMKNLFDE